MEKQIKTPEEFIKEDLGIKDATRATRTPKGDKNENITYTSYYENEKYILEQINSANHAYSANWESKEKFIIYSKVLGTTRVINEFITENRTIRPITGDLVDQKIILLPTEVVEYESLDKLIKEIKEFLFEYFEVPVFFENFLPFLVLFYWVYEKFPFIPYVHFMGKTGTGKTTAMDVLGSICYKPIDASGAITMASIFRITSLWRGTLLLDEFNPGGESYKEMISLLKSGVSNKAVLRVEGDKKKEVVAYIVKSPKIFTSERPISEAGLRSRLIEITMNQNKRRVPLYRQDEFLIKAEQIRNKLLLFRFRTLSTIDLSDIEYGFPELSMFQGRVQQVITPVYFMADTESRKKILNFASEQQNETLRERREALDGQLFELIYEQYKLGVHPTIKYLSDDVNKGTKYPQSERKIANLIRKVLELNVRKMGHENVTSVDLENSEDKIKELCEYYGIEYEKVDEAVLNAKDIFDIQ